MIHDNDIELIEKYLSDELTEEEGKEFNKKNVNDKEFSEEVLFRKNLKVASEGIVTAEFKAMFNNIHNESVNKKKRTKKFYMYSTIAVSAAALALLFFFIGNPMGENRKIENYIAEAGEINDLSIPNITGVNLKSDEEILSGSTGELKVAFIEKNELQNNQDRYFLKDGVLYLFTNSNDTINLFYKIDSNGKRIYYLCKNKQLFILKDLKENRLFDLQVVNDVDLEKYCQ